jgi:hypothetical protein
VFRRAAHEPRVILGVLLVVAAIAGGYGELHRVRAQADRDFARCGGARQASDCVSKRRPVSVGWVESSNNGFRREYNIAVQTRPNVTVSVLGLSASDVAPFRQIRETEVRYRAGRLVAIVAPDGTSLEVPFSFSTRLAVFGATAIVLGLLGFGSVAWGLTRVNRTPRP